MLLAPLATAAPALTLDLAAPGWAAWRVLVPPQSSVTFTTTFTGGEGLRADGGAVLKGAGSGGLAYVGVGHARARDAVYLSAAGVPLVGQPSRSALPDDTTSVTLQCASACVGGEVVVVRYATGSFTRATLGVDLAGATVLSRAQGSGGFALDLRRFDVASVEASPRFAAHAEAIDGLLVGALFSRDGATMLAAGPAGAQTCDCFFADEAHGPGAYVFAAEGGDAFLVGVDARIPPP